MEFLKKENTDEKIDTNDLLNFQEPKDEDRNLSDEELENLWKQVESFREENLKDLENEPITDEEYREMEAGPYEPIFDPGLGQWSIAKDIEEFYGKDILSRIRKDLDKNWWTESHGQISKDLYPVTSLDFFSRYWPFLTADENPGKGNLTY